MFFSKSPEESDSDNNACSMSFYVYLTTRDVAKSLYEKDLPVEHIS